MPDASLIGSSSEPSDPSGADDSGGGGGGVSVDLPVELLSQDGVPPGPGDTVQAQIDATVKSVSGKTATVQINAIDGQPVGQPDISDTGAPPGPAPGSTAALGAALRKGAAANALGIG